MQRLIMISGFVVLFTFQAFCSGSSNEISVTKDADKDFENLIVAAPETTIPQETPIVQEKSLEDMHILRLGSAPHIAEYSRGNEKPDYSYSEFQEGRYEANLKKFGVPFKNVLHNYYLEDMKDYLNRSGKANSALLAKKDYKRLGENFNSEFFKDACLRESESKKFSLAITDARTSKFLEEKSLENILSVIGNGGKVILTDINEKYPLDYHVSFLKVPDALKEDMLKCKDFYRSIGYDCGCNTSIFILSNYSDLIFKTYERTKVGSLMSGRIVPGMPGILGIYFRLKKSNLPCAVEVEKDLLKYLKKEYSYMFEEIDKTSNISLKDTPSIKELESYGQGPNIKRQGNLMRNPMDARIFLPEFLFLVKEAGMSIYEVVESDLLKLSQLAPEELAEYNKLKDQKEEIEHTIYTVLDTILDPELDTKVNGRKLYPPVYERTFDFKGMNITVSFYDNWELYKRSGKGGTDVEEYLYNLGNPRGHKTSDRIIVITKNS